MADAATIGRMPLARWARLLNLVRLKGAILPPGYHGQAPRLARAKTGLRNIPGSKRAIKKVLRFDGPSLCSLHFWAETARDKEGGNMLTHWPAH
jgi:hypothetical protein